MHFTLVELLILVFVVSYYFGGRDFFAPMTVQVITFLFASIACSYYMYSTSLNYALHSETVTLIVSCLAISTLIGILVHRLFKHVKVRSLSVDAESQQVTPISGWANIAVILVLLSTIFWLMIEIRRIGGEGSFHDVMNIFRHRNSHATDIEAKLPFLLRRLQHLAAAIFVIYGFNLIRFYKSMSVQTKIASFFIIFLCALSELLNGARGQIINNILSCAIIFHLLRIQKNGRYKTYSIGFILKIIAICCVILWLFASVKYFIGRNSTQNALDYITYYTGGEILNLDILLQNPKFNTDIFGKYTFYGLITNLRSLGLDIEPYTVHQEYNYIGGVGLGNVYSLFGIYFSDFGMVGVYVLHSIASIVFSVCYEYVKKRRGNTGILLFSLMYFASVLSFFAERFFSNIISITFFEKVIVVIILYKLLLQKRLRFKLGGKRYVFTTHFKEKSKHLV